MARSVTRTKFLEPWMIALIVLAVLVALAIVIGLLVYFLIYDQKLFYYSVSFRINNVQYHPNLEKQTSKDFRELSTNIETLVSLYFCCGVILWVCCFTKQYRKLKQKYCPAGSDQRFIKISLLLSTMIFRPLEAGQKGSAHHLGLKFVT
ncbi:Transmembrane protease serine 11D [Varanus komodoensis]|nr:Transmembrane protease serine 11D [Varanus komodoensis]